MKLSAILAPMIAAKASHEMIMQTILAFEAQETDALAEAQAKIDDGKAKVRDRVQRWRDARKTEVGNVTERYEPLQPVTERLTGADDARGDVLLKTQKIEPLKKESKSPVGELSAVLDAEHARAVVDHRQRIRKPLTAHAAKLLAGKFGNCADPNVAADAMIANGWQGFEPEWLDRPAARAGPGPKPNPLSDAFGRMSDLNNRAQHDRHPEPAESSVRYLPAAAGRS